MVTENKIIIGGLRWGVINYSWPFAKLEIGSNELIIKYLFGKRKLFRPKDLKGFSIYKSFSKGVVIHHRITEYPDYIVFWTGKSEEVLKLLEEFMERVK